MALTQAEQELFDLGAAAVPRLLTAEGASGETVAAHARVMNRAREQADYFVDQAFIGRAEEPWLDLHARGMGTRRQASETNEQLRARLQGVEDAVTPEALAAAVNAILAAAGMTAECGIVELRRDRAHFGTYGEDGRARAYFNRGYRMTTQGGQVTPLKFPAASAPYNATRRMIVMLPFGTSSTTLSAVTEALRKKRAGGFPVSFEIRLNP